MSVDDGCASDVRIADLASKYEIETIFYFPVEWHSLAYDKGYEPLGYDEAMKISQVHQIGSHTITHRHLTALPEVEAQKEIIGSKFMLERMFQTNITHFAPPRGYTNDKLSEFTLKFYEKQRLTKGEGLVHIHPDSGANYNVPWREYAKSIDVKEIWCHSWELDKYDLWGQLEEFLREVTHS
jgi:peptidoglycan/xylan/chitin deacetylase (PgdA/CDA1 family)